MLSVFRLHFSSSLNLHNSLLVEDECVQRFRSMPAAQLSRMHRSIEHTRHISFTRRKVRLLRMKLHIGHLDSTENSA